MKKKNDLLHHLTRHLLWMPKWIFVVAILSSTTWAAGSVDPRGPRADQAFRMRGKTDNATLALRLYRELHHDYPESAEWGWKLGFACYFNALRIIQEKKEKIAVFTEGRVAAKKSMELDPKCAPCYFWYAINSVLWGDQKGVFSTIFGLDEVRKNLWKSIELDPNYAYAGGYRLQGTIEEALPGILGGSNRRAREYYELAIKHAPDEPLNYQFLSRLLVKEYNEKERAIDLAKQGVSVPKPGPERLESLEAIEELKSFIKETQEILDQERKNKKDK